MKPKIKIVKLYGVYRVQFTIGVQTFFLEGGYDKKPEAKFLERMLKIAFSNMQKK